MHVSRRSLMLLISLLIACISVKIFSLNGDRVERIYATGIYPAISGFLRLLFGKLPFSFGDLLYSGVVLWLLWSGFRFVRYIISSSRRNNSARKWKRFAFFALRCFLIIYLLFNVLWGVNYNRIGIAAQLDLPTAEPVEADLLQINLLLVEKVNAAKIAAASAAKFSNKDELFRGVENAYKFAEKKFSFLSYHRPSLKASMFAAYGNAAGFTGYYNPFTGESQVNISGPDFTHPFTALHEAAHAIGYAKESEANFAAYLAATCSPDPHFQYSAYADLFLYANRSLYAEDSAASRLYRKMLDTLVIADYRARAKFSREKQSFIEPFIKLIYGKYLQSNSQPAGMLSYDKVTEFIIAYYKKFGKL